VYAKRPSVQASKRPSVQASKRHLCRPLVFTTTVIALSTAISPHPALATGPELPDLVFIDRDGSDVSRGLSIELAVDVGSPDPISPYTSNTFVDATTESFLDALPPGSNEVYSFLAWIRPDDNRPDLAGYYLTALQSGTLLTAADRDFVRATWLTDHKAHLAPLKATAQATVTGAGGVVDQVGDVLPYILFDAPKSVAEAIILSNEFDEIELLHPAGAWRRMGTGIETREAVKSWYFEVIGTDLSGSGLPDTSFDGASQHGAVIDLYHSDNFDHAGFWTGTQGQSPRRAIRPYQCHNSGCVLGGGPPYPVSPLSPHHNGTDWHATHVLSAFLGDVRNGQDPALPAGPIYAPWEFELLEDRSWIAPRATADAFYVQQTPSGNQNKKVTGAFLSALDHIADAVHVDTYDLTMIVSGYVPSSSAACNGRGISRAVDKAVQAGTMIMVGAGNEQQTLVHRTCRLIRPADALSAFTVASHDGGALSDFSSWASGPATLVDAAAPGHLDFVYHSVSSTALDSEYSDGMLPVSAFKPAECAMGAPGCTAPYRAAGTSFATPVVAGAQALYREFYHARYSRMIDLPGAQHTNLLLRTQPALGGSPSGYHHGEGGGHLNMVLTDSVALSGPWRWGSGWTCVRNGVARRAAVITASLPSSVQELRAVAWYPNESGSRTYVDLELRSSVDPDQLGTLVAQDTSDDVKKRVIVPSSGLTASAPYSLWLRGRQVRTNDPVCGSRRQQVYFAYLHRSHVD
jgi:subtilisin family serine protease